MEMFGTSTVYVILSFFWMDHVKGFTFSEITAAVRSSYSSTSRKRRRIPTTCCEEKPSWLDDAIGGIPAGEEEMDSYRDGIDLQPGIAGFAVEIGRAHV